MPLFIDVTFHELAHDRALEGAVHRWVARLVGTQLEIAHTRVRLERAGRRRTGAHVELALANGHTTLAVAAHEDPFVAIANAFRAARHQVLATKTMSPRVMPRLHASAA